MRFNWRRRLVLTAFATASMLSFAGCSSQQEQQGMGEEVAAEGQQEQGGQEGGQTAEAQGQEGQEGNGANAPVAEEGQGGPGENAGGNGGNVVANEAPAGGEAAPNGDVAGIISEMSNTPAEGQATAEAAPAPEGQATAEAAPAEAAPAEAAPAAAPAPAPATAAAPSAPAPAGVGMPQMGSKMAYIVEPGDTLGKIAQKIFGDQKRWRDMASFSGLDNPNHIYPGDVVYYALDDASKSFAQAYESSRRSKEVVREGDTLAAIAKRVYGKPNLWKHIWRQNDGIDNPDVLKAGMTVYFMEAGSLKSALNSLKSMDVNKIVSKKISKSINLMTQAFFTPIPAV